MRTETDRKHWFIVNILIKNSKLVYFYSVFFALFSVIIFAVFLSILFRSFWNKFFLNWKNVQSLYLLNGKVGPKLCPLNRFIEIKMNFGSMWMGHTQNYKWKIYYSLNILWDVSRAEELGNVSLIIELNESIGVAGQLTVFWPSRALVSHSVSGKIVQIRKSKRLSSSSYPIYSSKTIFSLKFNG